MNQETFKANIFIHKDKLFRFACRFMVNQQDAFDLVQEVLMKLWEIRDDLQGIVNTEAFAMRMTKNMALNKISRESVKARYESEYRLGHQQDHDPALTKDIVLRLIDSLPEKQRLVMYLRDIEEYDIVTICELTGMEENAIRVNLSRARNTVKGVLSKIFDYEERRIRAIKS